MPIDIVTQHTFVLVKMGVGKTETGRIVGLKLLRHGLMTTVTELCIVLSEP
jgi:hypothetical protein